MASQTEPWLLENGSVKCLTKENRQGHGRSLRTAHNMSSSSLRIKSDLTLVSKLQFPCLRNFLAHLQEVLLGTKLSVLFPAIPLAVLAQSCAFGRPWIFALSLLGLTPLAERVSFLTEQIAYYTGPTEMIIAILALTKGKIEVVKYSLLGSVLSNLLLVLGTSLFSAGIANLSTHQIFDRRQADVNSLMLMLSFLCHLLPLLFGYAATTSAVAAAASTLHLSRASSIVMLLAYIAYLVFQLWTHRQSFEAQEDENDDVPGEEAVIGFWSAFAWLVGMTLLIALLSEYVVNTIEEASTTWDLSVSFLSIILLPIVGNAAEHAGAIIFALKNKLDISLGVALGSATQIALFVIPLCVIVAWTMGVDMDLNFNLMETASLGLAIITTAFALQDGTSHYIKGLVLLLCYVIIAACFFVSNTQQDGINIPNLEIQSRRILLKSP
ncbi:vacuolar cation/proton exchanger 3-like isoform X2 [Cucurbita pepo subsp. pepo]|uniref:vacuolar cation/proton exchanger 3-like isoform X2 n=1 Tax=Cucurbita pepo subsp. pepo TaxID=3664 RepID=UPI000C9D6227|nr:vacuolar cation/proton exchanger 3-like isoform X2 [Cucurbita pepo subsp. pepo]